MTAVNLVLGGVRERLGEILLRSGLVSGEQLTRALEDARDHGVRLGAELMSTRVVDEEDVAKALADQFGLEYIPLDIRTLDPKVKAAIPEAAARRLNVLAVEVGQERVKVAIGDPSDVVVVDELRMNFGSRLEAVVAAPSRIRAGIDSAYTQHAVSLRLVDEPAPGQSDGASQVQIDASTSPDEAPAVEEVNRVLRRAIELGASDVHFVPRRSGLHVRARVDGVMRDVSVVPQQLRSAVIARLKVMGELDIAERRLPQDGRVSVSLAGVDMDLRVAMLPSALGEEAVLRIAYVGQKGLRNLDDLGLDGQVLARLRHALRNPAGAVIVAGPTGSGKTTTLYSAIAELNNGSRTIVSIEDPVESLIDGIVQVEVKPRAGLTFARGLRTILRADPDVILVGEIRDLETAEIALHAAMTGHLVLSTLHAQSAAAAFVRLRELGLPDTSIGSSVHTVLSQRLLRRPCHHCLRGEHVTFEEIERLGLSGDVPLFRPSGCHHCEFTGYTGRVGVYESLKVDDAVRAAMSGTASAIQAAAVAGGSTTLYELALGLCESGGTTVDEVIRVLGEPDD